MNTLLLLLLLKKYKIQSCCDDDGENRCYKIKCKNVATTFSGILGLCDELIDMFRAGTSSTEENKTLQLL